MVEKERQRYETIEMIGKNTLIQWFRIRIEKRQKTDVFKSVMQLKLFLLFQNSLPPFCVYCERSIKIWFLSVFLILCPILTAWN